MVAVVCSLKGNPLSFEGFLKLAGGAISLQMPKMVLLQASHFHRKHKAVGKKGTLPDYHPNSVKELNSKKR
jgi:hypothetical protein